MRGKSGPPADVQGVTQMGMIVFEAQDLDIPQQSARTFCIHPAAAVSGASFLKEISRDSYHHL